MHAVRARMLATGAAALTTLLVGCSLADAPTAPARAHDLLVLPQPALVPSAADASAAPVNRIRLIVSPSADSTELAVQTFDVSPTAATWRLSIVVPLPGGEMEASIFAYLLHVDAQGNESVQFSGRSGPFTLRSGADATPELTIVRGPLANLGTTSVTITSAPSVLAIGESATLAATATTSGPSTPTIFWTSLDPAVATLAGATVTAVAPGTARVVASAGPFADTVQIAVASPDEVPPEVVGVLPTGGAIDVSVGTLVTVIFDELIDPTSVSSSSITLSTGRGLPVAGSVSVEGSSIVFDPTAPLDTLTAYVATLAPGVRDVWGNQRTASFQWSFTTSAQRLAITGGFNPNINSIVAIGFDPTTRSLFIYPEFGTQISEFAQDGTQLPPTIPNPGIQSNDHDFDFLPEAAVIGGVQVGANTLLVMNGESDPLPNTVYAIDKATGSVLASVVISLTSSVGVSYHAARNTFFGIDWRRDVIEEIDPATGAMLASFPVAPVGAPSWTVFYGDIEVDQASGNLILVSSDQSVVRIMSPTGALLADVPVGQLEITGMSGIAWDDATGTAWISTTPGTVLQVVGITP